MTSTTVSTNKRHYAIEFEEGSSMKISLGGETADLSFLKEKEDSFHMILNGKSYNIEVAEINPESKEVSLTINNQPYTFSIKDKYDILLEKMGMSGMNAAKVSNLKAPMPGLVIDVVAAGGQAVKKGDPLLILEAMKMENILKSPADGIIKEIVVNKGETVDKNQLLVNFQ